MRTGVRDVRHLLIIGLVVLIAGATGCGSPDVPADPGATSSGEPGNQGTAEVVLSAPGRVEGLTEVIEVGSAMDGVLAEVAVDEGDRVDAGALLARLVCDDLEAALGAATADAEVAHESRLRVLRGSRDEERHVAQAETQAAQAILARAVQRNDRLDRLSQEGSSIVSEEDLDQAHRDLAVAQSELSAAEERENLVTAGPLPEEIARADAEVVASRRRVDEAAARVEKCRVVAPINATVVRRHLMPGEQVSLAFPRPIVSLADTTRMRVRAEIDERDVGRIEVGQSVEVSAEALGERRIVGRVARLGAMMGRKRIRTGDPAEKSDRDVLEVLIDLDESDPRLVVDLRVTVFFLSATFAER